MDAPLSHTLRSAAERLASTSVVTGFDGFVDEMITLVDERSGLDAFTRVETISRFGDLVKAAAGHNSLREIIVTRMDAGGCAINMGDGLATLGIKTTTYATVGNPVHAAFGDYAGKATLHSWGDTPGRTLAFEFADGKLMYSAVTPLADFTPEHVARCASDGGFARSCEAAGLIALTDWTLYPHMTACWKWLQDNVFSQLKHRPAFFLDLVDPSSRSADDILGMLKTLPDFERCGPTHLGLNQNEANILCRLSGKGSDQAIGLEMAMEQAGILRKALGISAIVIHARSYSVSADDKGQYSVQGVVCSNPVKCTGAGDRFNAGYATGILLGLNPEQRLKLATATSGLYVRQGRSPNLEEVANFCASWEAGTLVD